MRTRVVLTAAFVATVIGANWALERWGIVPVGFGLEAGAGVYFAGLAFGLRDALHERAGEHWRRWVVGAIVVGAVLSIIVAPSFAFASGAAFLFSELADLTVYAPLRERSWPVAVAASNTVGAVVDSLLFLWLAGLPLALWRGQVLGKSYMIVLALPLVLAARRDLPRDAVRPARP